MSRRTFLRSTGVALALPFLDVMEPSSGSAAARVRPPLRMGCVYLPNGVPFEAWKPDAVGGRLTRLNPWMKSLEPVREDLQFLTGLQSETSRELPHQGGSATWLVRPCDSGDLRTEIRNIGGVSMDQIVAQSLDGVTPFPSLELIIRPEGKKSTDLLLNNISWRTGNVPVPRASSPRAVFDRLTGAVAGTTDVPGDGSHAFERRSILDAVLDDARSLRRRVSHADQSKLDQYFDAVRGIEIRLDQAGREHHAAVREAAATLSIAPPPDEPADHGEYLRLMFDMLVLAFWTDSTRVATFMLDQEESYRYFDFIPGVRGMWHSLSHWRSINAGGENYEVSWPTESAKYRQYLKVIEYHHEHVAYFLRRLKATPEQDGSLLDHAMILYGSPFADGNAHAATNLPMLIAGRAGGAIRPGRRLDMPGGAAEGVFLSMMDRMGVVVDHLGGISQAVPIT